MAEERTIIGYRVDKFVDGRWSKIGTYETYEDAERILVAYLNVFGNKTIKDICIYEVETYDWLLDTI